MIMKDYFRHHPLHKIIYPMMALALILPVGLSTASSVKANADTNTKQPKTTQTAKNKGADSSKQGNQQLIYAAYQENSKKAQQQGQGLGQYVIRITFVPKKNLKGSNSNNIKNDWGNTKQNRTALKKKVNKRNKQLKHKKSAPKDASYLVPKDQQLANGTQSTKVGSHRHIHKGIVPVKVRSRTTLWDLARANLKHYNRHTAKQTVNRTAKALLKLNPKIHGIHKTVRKGTRLNIPTKKAKRFKTSFSAWAEFAAGLSKPERRAKRWIARVESTFNYHIWQGGRSHGGSGTPYGKYQLDAGYLHKDHGHKWDSAYAQEDIANQYTFKRYGSWTNAMRFHRAHGWY